MTPTKADPLSERMIHAFGRERVEQEIASMSRRRDCDPLWHLTDEARDVLLDRLIFNLKLSRKFAAANRKIYREQQEKQNVI